AFVNGMVENDTQGNTFWHDHQSVLFAWRVLAIETSYKPLYRAYDSSSPSKGFHMGTDGKPPRQWQEIAEEASHETEPEKLIILAVELERALELRDEKLRDRKERAS